jgi:hypothetical protein
MPSNRLNSDQIAGGSSGEPPVDERLNVNSKPEDCLNTNSASDAGQQQVYRLNTDIREHLETMWEGLLYLSEREFDAAIVGVADRIGMDAVVVYDTTKIIDILCERDGMDRDEAAEYYEFNIAGAYVGNRTPMFIAMIDDLIW